MHEPRQPRLTTSGGPRNGLPHPTRAYDYHGSGHDVLDPANCMCGENGAAPCKHAREARRENPRWKATAA